MLSASKAVGKECLEVGRDGTQYGAVHLEHLAVGAADGAVAQLLVVAQLVPHLGEVGLRREKGLSVVDCGACAPESIQNTAAGTRLADST